MVLSAKQTFRQLIFLAADEEGWEQLRQNLLRLTPVTFLDHKPDCEYDQDDDGANQHFDLNCPGCLFYMQRYGLDAER